MSEEQESTKSGPGEIRRSASDAPEVRSVAFYLPQYHPVPENDSWWGPGFTEWRNVVKARPLFRGHYQPHLPGELGFYDLRLPETREAQAALAKTYGLGAFCYFHYWFHGRRILERPFAEVLQSGEPKFPFLLCWANEPWTRSWDSDSSQVLIEQRYSDDDDLSHIRWLCGVFGDVRYLRYGGRPVFLVYRPTLMPDPRRTAEIWREEATRLGIGELYLVKVESYKEDRIDPVKIGFDAAVEFQPDVRIARPVMKPVARIRRKAVRMIERRPRGVIEYSDLARGAMEACFEEFAYTRFRCVTPQWDNSARKGRDALIVSNSSPAQFGAWMASAVEYARRHNNGLVFVNAWNEWAEGNHLEPDEASGRLYLEAHARALGLVDFPR